MKYKRNLISYINWFEMKYSPINVGNAFGCDSTKIVVTVTNQKPVQDRQNTKLKTTRVNAFNASS